MVVHGDNRIIGMIVNVDFVIIKINEGDEVVIVDLIEVIELNFIKMNV